MKSVSELPNGFLDEFELDESKKSVLISQVNRFNSISKMSISNKDIKLDALGNIIFPAGTIIHGTSNCDPEKIANIAKTGILTGQAVGISEDGETYYCADFHRVPNDISVDEFNSWFPYRDGRCPFGTHGKSSLAFVIQPCAEISELLSYDCYRLGTVNGDLTNSFVNYLPMSGDVASSILYGVPSSAISGVVMGDKLLRKGEIVDFISGLFPDSYIISKKGNLIYDPKYREMASHEIKELRRQNYLSILKVEELQMQLTYKEQAIVTEKNRYDKLMQGIIDTCSIDVAADILLASGWQADKEHTVRYVQSIMDSHSAKGK